MEDLPIVDVLEAKTDLGEPVEYSVLTKVLVGSLLFLSLDLGGKVSIITEAHDDAKLALFGLVDFFELHDIRMEKSF